MPAVVPTAPSACKSPTPGEVVSADRPGAATREAAPPPGESFR